MAEYTDCPTCGRTKSECDDSAARGHDACCMACDERGRGPNHRVLTVPDITSEEADR